MTSFSRARASQYGRLIGVGCTSGAAFAMQAPSSRTAVCSLMMPPVPET